MNPTPESEIRAAIEALRTSREALTEGERLQHWWAGRTADHWWINAGSSSVANAGLGDTARNAAQHIALVASPHVVQKFEHLLELLIALKRDKDDLNVSDLHDYVSATIGGADALAAAINRTEEAS